MRLLHSCLAFAVLVSWTVSADAAAGKKGNKGKGSRPIHGVVVAVTKDDGKDTGTITIQVQAHKKKGQAATTPPVEKTFQIATATKFATVQKVKGQKGQTEQTATTFASVAKGDRVLIQTNGDMAADVKLVLGGKKKKK